MRISKAIFLLGASVVFGSALQAAPVYNYAFGGLGNLGSNTHTFAPVNGPGPSITAAGFKLGTGSTVVAVNLFSKGSGAFPLPNDESGLGLTNDPTGDHEITPCSFIMLDRGASSISALGIYTESTTGGEEWKIWGSNTAAVAGHSFAIPTGLTGFGEGMQNVNSLDGDRYLFITSLKGNVLLGAVTETVATPEPASAGLLGLALLGSGLLFRRRLSQQAQQS